VGRRRKPTGEGETSRLFNEADEPTLMRVGSVARDRPTSSSTYIFPPAVTGSPYEEVIAIHPAETR
jgi:hypothetical protein